jgi:hypothetical protein
MSKEYTSVKVKSSKVDRLQTKQKIRTYLGGQELSKAVARAEPRV